MYKRQLLDRMEVIELHTYTRHEKSSIAKNHLIPKQRKFHGLTAKNLKFSDDAIYEIIDYYTSEAGVRNLEREIASICRKAAKRIVEYKALPDNDRKKGGECIKVSKKNLSEFLGARKIIPDSIENNDDIGEVNGLAYTEAGGDLLHIEAVSMPGTCLLYTSKKEYTYTESKSQNSGNYHDNIHDTFSKFCAKPFLKF